MRVVFLGLGIMGSRMAARLHGAGHDLTVWNRTAATASDWILIAGRALGIDLDALLEILSSGAGGSAVLTAKGAAMREHDDTTRFRLAHMLKDVELFLGEARAAGLVHPAAEQARADLAAAVADGRGDEDYGAALEVLERRSGVRI